MAARIRKGDTVIVISGSDKGKRGEGHLGSYVALVPQAAAGVSNVGDPRRGGT